MVFTIPKTTSYLKHTSRQLSAPLPLVLEHQHQVVQSMALGHLACPVPHVPVGALGTPFEAPGVGRARAEKVPNVSWHFWYIEGAWPHMGRKSS
jgi:hypothetical protein